MPLGSAIHASGLVIARLGDLAEPQLFAIQDQTTGDGIFVLAPSASVGPPLGAEVTIDGQLLLRRQALTVVISAVPSLVTLAGGAIAVAERVVAPTPGAWAWEPWEGRRISVRGTLAGAAAELSGGALSLKLRLANGEILAVGVGVSIRAGLPTALFQPGAQVMATGVLHQRGGSAGGGYRLWIDPVAGLVPPLTTGETGGMATGGSKGTGGVTTGSSGHGVGHAANATTARLPFNFPSIVLAAQAPSGWLQALFTHLFVRAGRLEYGLGTPVVLVQLPLCAGPRGARAGIKVDRAWGRAYAQPR